jgi:hypothetical protein
MVRSGAEYRAVADAGRTRAAEGKLVANFLLLKSDGPISGFAKNGDAIVLPESGHTGAIIWPRDTSLNLGLLGDFQCVIDFDAEVAHSAFQFAVAKQQLNGPEILRSLVD